MDHLFEDYNPPVQYSEKGDASKILLPVEDQKVEYVFIDNGTGKDIVCVANQTGCNLGCQFCFLTHSQKPARQIHASITHSAVLKMLENKPQPAKDNDVLLVSFMGAGEPLLDIDGLLASCMLIKTDPRLRRLYRIIRFGFATSLPRGLEAHLVVLNQIARSLDLDLKLHWSLHSTTDQQRSELMPNSLSIPLSSLQVRQWFGKKEIHYTLFEGNDTNEDILRLADIAEACAGSNSMPIKLLKFMEFPGGDTKPSPRTEEFAAALQERLQGCKPYVEIYSPPGADILAACGAFEV